MKRNISFFLLLAMLMAGCGSGNAQTDETNAVSNDTDAVTEAVTENPYLDNLPADLRFDGKTFDIYTYQGGNLAATVGRNSYNLAVHEENGEVLNDAGYRSLRFCNPFFHAWEEPVRIRICDDQCKQNRACLP